jgi:hypothetical protein
MAELIKEIPFWQKWGKEELSRKREEVGSREFARGWMQRALSADETLFRQEHIDQCLNTDRKLIFPGSDNLEDAVPRKTDLIYMGVDLAIAGKASQGDYFVITVISVDRKKYHRTLIGLYRNRGLTFNEQLKKVELWAGFFKPDTILVETNAYQEAFTQELSRTTDLPVKSFKTTAVNKHDMQDGLPRMSVEFENAKWTIPYAPGMTREVCAVLVAELATYPLSKHDDTLMSLWFARNAATMIETRVEKRIIIV